MKSDYSNTWEGVVEAAKDAGAKYPELVAAQWALESAWGKSTSGKHNYFGIKGKGTVTRTTEFINGARVHVDAEFKNFMSLGQCVEYLVQRWYLDWKTYQGVNHASSAEDAAKALVKQGYATDPAYATKLIKLLKDKGATAPSSGGSAGSGGKALYRMEATCDTWLKKELEDSSKLGEDQRKAVEKGKGYGVTQYTEIAADGHAKVQLAGGAGMWFIYEAHWRRLLTESGASSSVNWGDFSSRVTKDLTVGEIVQWDKRRVPPEGDGMRGRLLKTAQAFQEIRTAWGSSLGVTSFYRPEPINRQVGGVPGSKHTTGQAFDVYPSSGRSLEEFYQWIRVRWTGGLGDGRHRGFIHLDTDDGTGHFVPGAGVRPRREWTY